jgi:hypothetical protein
VEKQAVQEEIEEADGMARFDKIRSLFGKGSAAQAAGAPILPSQGDNLSPDIPPSTSGDSSTQTGTGKRRRVNIFSRASVVLFCLVVIANIIDWVFLSKGNVYEYHHPRMIGNMENVCGVLWHLTVLISVLAILVWKWFPPGYFPVGIVLLYLFSVIVVPYEVRDRWHFRPLSAELSMDVALNLRRLCGLIAIYNHDHPQYPSSLKDLDYSDDPTYFRQFGHPPASRWSTDILATFDPFAPLEEKENAYRYWFASPDDQNKEGCYVVWSRGPDTCFNLTSQQLQSHFKAGGVPGVSRYVISVQFDATNGYTSDGDIIRGGGDSAY